MVTALAGQRCGRAGLSTSFVSTPDPTAGLGRRLVSAGSIRHPFPAPVLAASRPVGAGVSPNLDLDGKCPETFRQEPAPVGAVSFSAFCTDPTLVSAQFRAIIAGKR